MIIYFCFVLIGLINDYKNIYSRNSNVCLGICEMVFMRIITFKNYRSYEKGLWTGERGVFVFVGMIF